MAHSLWNLYQTPVPRRGSPISFRLVPRWWQPPSQRSGASPGSSATSGSSSSELDSLGPELATDEISLATSDPSDAEELLSDSPCEDAGKARSKRATGGSGGPSVDTVAERDDSPLGAPHPCPPSPSLPALGVIRGEYSGGGEGRPTGPSAAAGDTGVPSPRAPGDRLGNCGHPDELT